SPPFASQARPPRASGPSLHDALPIWARTWATNEWAGADMKPGLRALNAGQKRRSDRGPTSHRMLAPAKARMPRSSTRRTHSASRSEEHTSELQSREKLVCRLLLEKKK